MRVQSSALTRATGTRYFIATCAASLAFAHLLLDRFRQQLHQRQPPRYPTRAAVEAARQFIQSIAEALLHLRQQPALFERAFLRAEPQRPRQQQSFGFAHRPDRGFDRVPAQLFQRGHALVAIDHQVTVRRVRRDDHDDGRLLAAVSQRRQQPALPLRLADSQMFPSPVQLVKLQLHRCLLGIQYARGWNWSFRGEGGSVLGSPRRINEIRAELVFRGAQD